jgi:hypothetical protein
MDLQMGTMSAIDAIWRDYYSQARRKPTWRNGPERKATQQRPRECR